MDKYLTMKSIEVDTDFLIGFFGVTRETLFQWRMTKQLPYWRQRGKVMFDLHQVIAWHNEFLQQRNKRKPYGPRKGKKK